MVQCECMEAFASTDVRESIVQKEVDVKRIHDMAAARRDSNSAHVLYGYVSAARYVT